MPRLAGVDLPEKKKVKIALTYIFGIGRSRAKTIADAAGIDPDKRVHDLTEAEVARLRNEIEQYRVEGDLQRKVKADIQRLKDIDAYRGRRHKQGLPVRGQKTRSNARTWKGPRESKAGK
ncbi:MAG: 30S ribosomal protein S13 [Candidatus Acetothermia bacterium]